MNSISNVSEGIEKLLEPITVGNMELRNRMAMPPLTMCYTTETGGVSQWDLDYFAERAKGGVGLIIVGAVCVESKLGKIFAPSPLWCIDSDEYVAGYSRLVDTIHDYGAKAAIQIMHAGRQTTLEKTGGIQPVSSSDIETALLGFIPVPSARALTIDEILVIEDGFAEAARRAKTAGFDAVSVNGGAGYLIAQFMSPFVNKRKDEYGGDLQSRMRFPLKIIEKIKEKVGTDYPLFFDLPVDEFIDGGIRLEESKIMARMLEEVGIVAFRMHGSLYETYQYVLPPAAVPRGVHAPLAKGIKETVKDAKVMLGHRINDPLLAENILRQGMADIILLGRPLIADPEFPKKVSEGRLEDIRKCIACNIGCASRIVMGLPATCTVNPLVGKEKEYRLLRTQSPKKVFIIGGGVGGMEAARVAALRGHQVTLWEMSNQLGGQALIATIPPNKYEIKGLVEYFITQLKKLKVDIHLGIEMTSEEILKHRPRVLIVATGSEPTVPAIPGAGKEHVVKAWDVLTEKVDTGTKVVIVGGGQTALETAAFLAQKGKEVIILEMLPEVGNDMELFTKVLLIRSINEAGVRIRTNSKVDEIVQGGVKSGNELIQADSVVLATGQKPNNALYFSLKGKIPEVYTIGDCVKPRNMLNAIHDGARVARLL